MTDLNHVYWNLSNQIMAYAVDSGKLEPLTIDGEEISTINEELFLSQIYATRAHGEFEQAIVRKMLDTNSVFCIAGGRGSGKTSALRFSIRLLLESHPEISVEVVDVKRIYNAKSFSRLTKGNATIAFQSMIMVNLMAGLFGSGGPGRDIFAWLLAGEPGPKDRFQVDLVADLYKHYFPLLQKVSSGSNSRWDRFEALRDYFKKHPGHLAEISKGVLEDLRVAHIVQAYVSLNPSIKKLIIVYDNVDRIPAAFQPQFLGILKDTQLHLSNVAGTVVAIRLDNIRGKKPYPGQGGDVFVRLSPDELEMPCVLAPLASTEHVKKVIENRHEFTVAICEAMAEELSDVNIVFDAVVSEFLDHRIALLANGSIRNVNLVYNQFIQFLQLLSRRKIIKDVKEICSRRRKFAGHLQTLFFLWLREHGHIYGVMLYDIFKIPRRPQSEESKFSEIASERHLLLTCIYNLTRLDLAEGDPLRFPQVSQVFRRMEVLGYSVQDLISALMDLVARPGAEARLLEFFESECNIEDLRESSLDRIRLTSAGEVLITDVLSKVGYVWGSAYSRMDFRGSARAYLEYDLEERMSIFYEFVADMSKDHLWMLSLLGNESRASLGGKRWLHRYKQFFGVDGTVQVARILESATSFFAPHFDVDETNPFERLLEAYSALQLQVGRGKGFDELDFHEFENALEAVPWTSNRVRSQKRKLYPGDSSLAI